MVSLDRFPHLHIYSTNRCGSRQTVVRSHGTALFELDKLRQSEEVASVIPMKVPQDEVPDLDEESNMHASIPFGLLAASFVFGN